MRIRFTLSILLLFVLQIAFTQKAIVKGIVTDDESGESLLGANVKIGTTGTATDFEGNYRIEIAAGTYTIEFSYVSYESIKKEVELKAGEELELNIEMKEMETMLNTATVTSSKFEKPLGEVTVSLEVVKPTLIDNTNAVAANEVLDKIPGVSMLDDQVDIRGGAGYAQGTGSRVLLMMDDLPVLQADAGLPQWRDLPTENIAQMEVLKGAASALYGSAAMNGIINIRTAYPTAKPYTKVSLSGKTFMAPKDPNNKWWTQETQPFESNLQFAHRQKFNKLDLVAGGNVYVDRSFMRGTDRDTAGGVDTLPNYVRAGRATVNLRYRFSEKLMVGLNTNINIGQQNRHLFWRTDSIGSLYEATNQSIPIRGQYARFTIDPSVTYYDNAGGRHRFQSRYYFINNDNENEQSNSSDYVFGEYQYQKRFAELQDLELSTGVVGSFSAVEAEVYGGNSFQLGNFAAYAQVEKKFFDRLNVSLGVRYEYNLLNAPDTVVQFATIGGVVYPLDTFLNSSASEGRPIFRFGANYQLLEGTFLRVSWGQAYRFPTILEKYVSTSPGTLGVIANPELTSETGWSSEIGIKQGFKVGNWQGFLDVAAFWTEYFNMMEFQFMTVAFMVNNVGDTRIRGGEVSLMGQGKIGEVDINLISGYTYLDPRYQEFTESIRESSSDTVNILKYRSRHNAKMDVQATYKGASLGLTFAYFSFVQAIDAYLDSPQTFPSIYAFRNRPDVQDGALIMNARVSYKYKMAKISLLGNNLLNTEYVTRPGRLEAPRNIALRLDVTFEGKEKKKAVN
jgi:outer membrane receptor protein involved in Fe transport